MPEGLRKIDGSKNYYQSADGRVFLIKEISPYKKGSRNYYQIKGEDGSKIYYSSMVVKTTTETPQVLQVVETTTNKVTAPKQKISKQELDDLIF